MINIELSGNVIDYEHIKNILFGKQINISMTKNSEDAVKKSRERVEDVINKGKVVYGITTGFGKFSEKVISKNDVEKLQTNLIRSHSCGMGEDLPPNVIKLAMILRANSLSKGYSGIRPNTLNTLIEIINKNIIPVVPAQGSLGASGDLAPLSHIALVLLGEGLVWNNGKKVPSMELLNKYNVKPIKLEGKEGLALINGTPVTLAILLNALFKADTLLKTADIATAMTLQAYMGTPDAFDEDIHKLRPHKGQIATAENIRNLIKGSKLTRTYSQNGRVQDAYSLRCVPQVHGASRDALYYVRNIAETEIGSVTDNPLVFEDKILSGGNFHAQHLGIASDTMKIALAEIGNISERRVERLLNPNLTNQKGFLANEPGVESGFMIAQYTSASIVSENKALSHPATVDSIPVSGNQEDHCSMAPIGARKALEIAENVEKVLAIELMIASQSIELRGLENASKPIEAVVNKIREYVPGLDKDRMLYEDMNNIKKLIANRVIVDTAESISGTLNY